MAATPRTIRVEPGSDMDRLLRQAGADPLFLVSGELRFRVVPESAPDDIWMAYDADASLAGTLEAAGTWTTVDTAAFKRDSRERRRSSRRSPVEL